MRIILGPRIWMNYLFTKVLIVFSSFPSRSNIRKTNFRSSRSCSSHSCHRGKLLSGRADWRYSNFILSIRRQAFQQKYIALCFLFLNDFRRRLDVDLFRVKKFLPWFQKKMSYVILSSFLIASNKRVFSPLDIHSVFRRTQFYQENALLIRFAIFGEYFFVN